jgi:cytoskeleton protein RodZ
MQTIGERLEEARKKKGISIREAAEATKIRGDYLQKFESNHFDIDLTEIYTRGFLRSYAVFLRLPADRILSDYSALGRAEPRPRQPSREVYGRMDISVASAGEASDRAAPPDEDAAAAEPLHAQPRYPRGSSSLPTGPDPALIFKYVKWGGIAVVALAAIWIIKSLASGDRSRADSQPASVVTPAARPAADNRVVITALDVVRVQVWEKVSNAPTPEASFGAVLIPATTLMKGESTTFPKTGSVYVYASAQENIQIDVAGRRILPSSYGHKGAMSIQLD